MPTRYLEAAVVVAGDNNALAGALGADVGYVSGQSAQWLLGQTLAGAAIGVRGQMKAGGQLYYDIFASHALKKPEYFQTKKWVTGFQVSYSF